MFTRLDDQVSVAAQIAPADVAVAAAMGTRLIVNNRPDGEEPGQPDGAAIEAAAAVAGIDYIAIPVTHSGFSHAQLEAMNAALDHTDGQVLAYCRSGTRSTYLWALAKAGRGADPHELAGKAAEAGYDLTSIRPMLDALAARA